MKIFDYIIIILVFSFCLFSILESFAGPLEDTGDLLEHSTHFRTEAGFAAANPGSDISGIIATVIRVFISVLGIVFVVLLVMAGYKYFNSRGNEEKVSEALDSIKRAIIGLIIVASAFAITEFVFRAIDWVEPGSGGPSVR